MKKTLNKFVKYSPSILSITLLMANTAQALPTPPENQTSPKNSIGVSDLESKKPTQTSPKNSIGVSDLESETSIEGITSGIKGASDLEVVDPMGQVTSVSQLSDVQPTDWAFQALQSLVERYGCIAGYPDGTFKGNRAMTRYEFAAGLNACLDRITELVAAATADLVTRDDLAVLQRLQEEFAVELAELRGRVDALEARSAELEANQFSTTTKLDGEVLFWVTDTYGERAQARGEASANDKTETTFSYRVRLNFETSFTGEDLLFTRLQATDIPDLSGENLTNTLMTLAGIDEGDGDDTVIIDLFFYSFPVGDKAQVLVGPTGVDLDDVSTVLTPLQDEGDGTISRFGRRNPTSFRGPAGAGLGIQYAFNETFLLEIAYLSGEPEDPNEGAGIFNGDYSALGQLIIQPNPNLSFGLGYVRKYWGKNDVDVSGGTGSFKAQDPFDGTPTTADNVGFQANWRVNERIEIGGWFGSTWTRPENDNGDDDDVTIINGMLYVAFPDLFKEGNMGGIMVGVPPIVTDGGDDDSLKDDDTSIHIEAIYRFQLNDNISVTPGLFVITNPNHDDFNDTIWVTTLRTTFRF
ncbi:MULTISPECIES: iron uptake porin [unclassified Okeania]|uniref:iron uptake porin n=1 Tax=unclassified Okeania TaxID=2634635 RepID=UPI0013B8FD5D|nr:MULTISPECIES: iron uptake porin [unclassified Okeania]NES74776.1 iron uptake porin [Okeania sp. SIO1H4]NET14442.1 iron uptake porin [Okeania sp. SIO1H6]NET18923.1 iron uptake porin [Okeania sp. SIO1H5]NET94437.1 iron uptake porin [Okeania sp. SIO1H2]